MSENEIKKNISQSGANLIGKLNLHTIFHALWLIELYYLGINSLLNIVLNYDFTFIEIVPNEVQQYNSIIMSYFEQYIYFIIFSAVGLLLCGTAFVFISRIPLLCNYQLIRDYSSYGVTSGLWLLALCTTYQLYKDIKLGVLFAPIIIYLFIELIRWLRKLIDRILGYDDY